MEEGEIEGSDWDLEEGEIESSDEDSSKKYHRIIHTFIIALTMRV